MRSKILAFLAVQGRIMAHLQGFDPLDVWASYRIFEDDMSTLIDVLEGLGDSAKPFLEMREREREERRRAIEQAASSIVYVPATNAADGAATEEIERERGVRRQERVHDLSDEE